MTDQQSDGLVPLESQDQMSLFEIIESPNAQRRYSNTIELYDALPKYRWEQQREFSLDQAEMVRHCTIRGIDYKVVVKPAILRRGNRNVLIYPGQREEIIEDALRKLAVAGHGQMMENNAGVTFTLYQLHQELKNSGHGFDINDIKEAIMVCRGATLECYGDNGESVISSSFFTTIGLTNKAEWLKQGTDARCFVMFNPLVTKSILELTFRPFNYSVGMSLNSPLARFIYKRMSHYWTQASEADPYTPSLVSFLGQSPRGLSTRMSENIRAMKNALDLLIKQEVVRDYEANQVKVGRSIVDVRYVIWPHDRFVKDAMAANKAKRNIQMQSLKASIKKTG